MHVCLKAAVPFDVLMNKVAARIPDKWKRVGTQMNLAPAKIDVQYIGNPDDCYRKVCLGSGVHMKLKTGLNCLQYSVPTMLLKWY